MYSGNREPPLAEMFADPMVHLVLARDRLRLADVRAQIEAAKRRRLETHVNIVLRFNCEAAHELLADPAEHR